MKPLSRKTIIITALVQLVVMLFGLLPSQVGFFEHLVPAWFVPIQFPLVITAIVILFAGLQLQHFRLYLGLWTVVVGCVLLGLTLSPKMDAGFFVACYEAWFMGAMVQRYRRAWLAGLIGGSLFFGGIFAYLYMALSIDFEGVTQSEYFQDPTNRTNTIMAISVLGGLLVAGLLALWQIGSNRQRMYREVMDLKAQAELAGLRERQRIAREMHDIVAHSLTVVIAQSDGGRYAGAKDPTKAMDALATIGTVSREALKEMRGLLSVLRAEDGEEAPRSSSLQPGLGDIDELVRRGRDAGLDIMLTRKGEEKPLNQAAQLNIYRIVQECFTNVLKHCGTVQVLMSIDWESGTEVVIRIDNAGPEDPKAPNPVAGKGLQGIAERARLMAGSATWGPSPLYPGGWAVEVHVPLAANKATR